MPRGADDSRAAGHGGGRDDRGGDDSNRYRSREGSSVAAQAAAGKSRAQSAYDDLMGERDTIEAHWNTIQQWRIDEGKSYARTRGSQTARMAAGGMKAGTEQWNASLAAIDEAHATELAGYDSSATMGIINRWIDKVRAVEPTSSAGQSTDEFMQANFGNADGYSASTGASESQGAGAGAVVDPRRRGAGQVQEASPWWA